MKGGFPKSSLTQWITFIVGITLVLLATEYIDVVPVVMFGVTHSIEDIFRERLQWWLSSAVFCLIAFLPVMCVNPGESIWTRLGKLPGFVGLLMIARVLVWLPAVLVLDNNYLLPPYDQETIGLSRDALFPGLSFPFSLLVFLTAAVNIWTVWLIMRSRMRVTGFPLLLMIIITAVIGDVAIRIRPAAGILLGLSPLALNQFVTKWVEGRRQ